jgi:cell division inhibitor SulA
MSSMIPSASANQAIYSNGPGFHYCQQQATSTTSQQLETLFERHQADRGWTLILAPESESLKVLAEAEAAQQNRTLLIHRKQIQNLADTLKKAILAGTCSTIISFGDLLSTEEHYELTTLATHYGCTVYWFSHNSMQRPH